MSSVRRHTILDDAVYLVRHFCTSDQRVEGLATLEWNAMTGPLGAVNSQDRAKDELCVRLSSINESQDACTGKKWNAKVRAG